MYDKKPLQFDQPLFVRIPFVAAARDYEPGDHFPWLTIGIDRTKVQILFNQGYLDHDEDMEQDLVVGDGLEASSIEQLHNLVQDYTDRVARFHPKGTVQFESKRPKKSNIHSKQIGLIRSWRRSYLKWLEESEGNL
jgi:hypothetical protein